MRDHDRCRRAASRAPYRVDNFDFSFPQELRVQPFGAPVVPWPRSPFWMRFSSWLGLDSVLSRTRADCVATANALSSEHQCIARIKSKVTIICLGKALHLRSGVRLIYDWMDLVRLMASSMSRVTRAWRSGRT
jgi:hypothetical protein